MSASAWDRAVEAAAEANGQTEPLAARYRESIEQALAAALPVLLEELAQRIEARKTPYAVPGDNEWNGGLFYGAEIVRGFAAEVTQ